MCGIAGYLAYDARHETDKLAAIVSGMARSLQHRGPDDEGIWVDAGSAIAFGHRRLSIIDLSQAGHQPMMSASGRHVIVLNGEIYNFNELRDELLGQGYKFRGGSDTEVAVNAIEHWGLEKALSRFTGMFAFGVWDRERRVLSLARDRLGEKPLYYGWVDSGFVFASELKAIRAHPDCRPRINRDAPGLLVKYSYIPAPHTIYEQISKLMPGTVYEIPFPPNHADGRRWTYWSFDQVVASSLASPRDDRDIRTVADEFEQLLKSTLRDKMISDVPLGAFLSGGIDSSLIVALMQAQSNRPISTFTIGFHEPGFDEALHARQVAAHLGTEHTELYVTPEQAIACVPLLASIYDEPFADSSQIPTLLISRLGREKVVVALSGDGGDELFGGYNRYIAGNYLLNRLGVLPLPVRRLVAKSLATLPEQTVDRIYRCVRPLLPPRYRYNQVGLKLQKLAGMLERPEPARIYDSLISMWDHPEQAVITAGRYDTALDPRMLPEMPVSYPEWMMYMDTITYLPDDILVKVDRASMAVSLEIRVPLLDHRIVEFAWGLSPALKIGGNTGKRLLREVLDRYVPGHLIDRPKMGFGIPLAEWLRGPLRDWAEDLLDADHMRQQGYFHAESIRDKWNEHLERRNNWHYQLWPVLMFQDWHRRWMEG